MSGGDERSARALNNDGSTVTLTDGTRWPAAGRVDALRWSCILASVEEDVGRVRDREHQGEQRERACTALATLEPVAVSARRWMLVEDLLHCKPFG